MSAWPVARVDDVARLRALAAALPHVHLAEAVILATFEQVWAVAGDLEGGVPRFERAVRSLEITGRDGGQLRVTSRSPLGTRMRFRAVLRSGWCVMHSRWADIGMAAAPEGDGSRTRFAHFEGSRVLGRLARPLFARNVRGDLERLARVVRAASR